MVVKLNTVEQSQYYQNKWENIKMIIKTTAGFRSDDHPDWSSFHVESLASVIHSSSFYPLLDTFSTLL